MPDSSKQPPEVPPAPDLPPVSKQRPSSELNEMGDQGDGAVPSAPDLRPVSEQRPSSELNEMRHQGDGVVPSAHGKKPSFTIGIKKLPLKIGNIEDLRITHLILPQSIGVQLGWQTRDDEPTAPIKIGNRIEDVSLVPQSESENEANNNNGDNVNLSFKIMKFQPVRNIFSFQKKFKLRRYGKISMMEAKKSFSPNQLSDFQSESKQFNYLLEGPFKSRFINRESPPHSWGKVGRVWKPFSVRFINTVKSLEGEDEVPLQTAATILFQCSKSNPARIKDLRVDGRLMMRRW